MTFLTAMRRFRLDNLKSKSGPADKKPPRRPKWVGLLGLALTFVVCVPAGQAQQPAKISRVRRAPLRYAGKRPQRCGFSAKYARPRLPRGEKCIDGIPFRRRQTRTARGSCRRTGAAQSRCDSCPWRRCRAGRAESNQDDSYRHVGEQRSGAIGDCRQPGPSWGQHYRHHTDSRRTGGEKIGAIKGNRAENFTSGGAVESRSRRSRVSRDSERGPGDESTVAIAASPARRGIRRPIRCRH